MSDHELGGEATESPKPKGKNTRTPKKRKKTPRSTATRKKSATRKRRKRTTRKRRTGLSTLTTGELRAEVQRRLRALETKREKLLADVEAIDNEMASLDSLAAPQGSRTRKKAARKEKRGRTAATRKKRSTRRRARNSMSLVDALKNAMGRKTMGISELAAAVKKAGYRSRSANFQSIVNQTLLKHPKVFKRVERGMYAKR